MNDLCCHDMEISDCLTNVLSINGFQSIQYYYLELSINFEQDPTTILDIEAAWRKSGALVVRYKSGIWMFGKGGEQGQKLPSGAIIKADGLVEFSNNVLAIKQEGTFDPSDVWKTTKLLMNPTLNTPTATTTTPPSSADSNSRSIQAINTRAFQINAAIGVQNEIGLEPSPVAGDFATREPIYPARDAQEQFISAVLAALNYRLCYDHGFLALNARTLILPPSDYSQMDLDNSEAARVTIHREGIWLITLDAHLTSLGTLLLRAWPKRTFELLWSLSPKHDAGFSRPPVNGATFLLAPTGRVGRYCGTSILDVKSTMLDVAGTPVGKVHESLPQEDSLKRWKQRCLNWLADKGMKINALESSSWLMVQVSLQYNPLDPTNVDDDRLWNPADDLITIAWPAFLCFQRRASDLVEHSTSKKFGDYDPLLFAEKWFSARIMREATIAKRRMERQSSAAAIQAQVEVDTRQFLNANTLSPAGLRRASLAGAVYPTPPDGVQPPIGATPSFEGNGSTPGQPNPSSSALESENVVPKSEPDYTDGSLWDSGESKRDQINPPTLDFNDNENEHLFGDMGGDLFGENDITDADFSFFDEPNPVGNVQGHPVADDNSFETTKEGAKECVAAGDTLLDNTGSGAEVDVVMIEANIDENLRTEQGEGSRSKETRVEVGSNVDSDPSGSPKLASTIKSPRPPLSPGLIFDKISAGAVGSGDTNGDNPALGSFGVVPFDQSMSSFDKKYGAQGRFAYPSPSRPSDRQVSKTLPRTEYLKRTRKRRQAVAKLPGQPFISLQKSIKADNLGILGDMGSPSCLHSESPVSDQDDISSSSGDDSLDFFPSLKRKRGKYEAKDTDREMTSSFHDLRVDNLQDPQVLDPLHFLDHTLLDPDPADWSLTSFLSTPEPIHLTGSLNDNEYIASAQVLVDQAVFRTFSTSSLFDNFAKNHADKCIDRHGINSMLHRKFSQAAKSCFDRAENCTPAMLVDTKDLQQHAPGTLVVTRPSQMPLGAYNSEMKTTSIFNLPPPHLEVQRSDSKLAVLPSAMPFWESLGLAPCRGSKDVRAICIYPDRAGMAESVEAFLDQLRNAYESSRLGLHERFSHADLADGHVPMDFVDAASLLVADHQAVLLKIRETSKKVGTLLAASTVDETNLVIYFIYDLESPELVVPICSASDKLMEAYRESLGNEMPSAPTKLVFQLVPMSLVTSKDNLVVPPPTEYTRLAMEVYDRCVDLNTGTSVPSIILEQPLPKGIAFRPTTYPPTSLLHENTYIHVAYAQSLDDRWITAAWTDNTGTQQMTASYCLGRRNSPLTASFPEIAREIWETTLEIIPGRKVNCRIWIVKSGIMHPPEMEAWQSLASATQQSLAAKETNASIALALITVDTNPSLELLPPSVSVAPNVLAAQSSLYTTPVSTPQATIFSPEPGSVSTPTRDAGPINATTPNESHAEQQSRLDADATLIDLTDQTWGVVLQHRLNNSRSLLDFNPTLISGYLIKRSGVAATDAPIIIEVNLLLHGNLRILDPLLREILGVYRGLATVARARGCVHPVRDGRPWHIAAVERGVQALYMLM